MLDPTESKLRSVLGLLTVGALVAASPVAAGSQSGPPSPESVLGYALGARVTDYHGMEHYFSTLADASPRVLFGAYGEDYEGRQLRYAVVSSERNLGQLESIRAATASLADPRRLSESQAAELVEATPVVVWLNYGIDGNETAGLESALLMAHHLAADDSPATAELLDDAVVVITPVSNPSSHERWASWSNSFAALGGNPDPLSMEHHPPWGILTNNNHYLVDLNRESVWAIQRESAALRDPLYSSAQRRWLDRFGRSIGRRFAADGWPYSPWETGSFYPGYWESFGTLNGAVGFTYETMGGGSRGLRQRREDGSLATLELAARQHFAASLAVIETSVEARRELLRDYLEFRRSAVRMAGEVAERAFIVEPGPDRERTALVIDILLANRIEVFRTTEPMIVGAVDDYFGRRWSTKELPSGSFVIPTAQPQARLLLTMMRRDLGLPQATLEAAEEFRSNQKRPGYYNAKIARTTYLFYDVTAWSMPLTFDISAYWTAEVIGGELVKVEAVAARPPTPAIEEADYGYAFTGDGIAASAMTIDLLQRGLVLHVAYDGFTIGGRGYPRGSVVIREERNPGVDLPAVLGEAALRHGVAVDGIDATYSETGPSMGSDRFVFVRRPRVAVLAGAPVSVRSFGDLWFTFERQYGLEFSAVRKQQLDAETLDHYDVLVLPDGGYNAGTFSRGFVEALESWVQRGGSLVGLKRAARWATDPNLGLTASRMRPATWAPADGGEPPRETMSVPGAILRAQVDQRQYLTFGYRDEVPVLVDSGLAIEPDGGVAAPVSFAARDTLRLAGFAYADSLDRLATTPYVIDERVGAGHVILFLDDPNFRNYWRGLSRLFLNSVLLSPSF
jgi:hypothetical protein